MLIRGLCLDLTDFIQCVFDGRASFGRYVDGNTALCTTPVMATLGTVNVSVRRLRSGTGITEVSTTFTTGIITNHLFSQYSTESAVI